MALTATLEEIIERNENGLLGKHESWSRVRLGDVAAIQNGVAYSSKLFNTREVGMPLLRIRDVGRDRTEAFYTGPYEEGDVVHPGDLVIGMDGDFKCARWAGPPALLNQRVCRVNLRHADTVDAAFLLLALPGYLDAINAATSSITVKHLSSKTMADLLIPLPSIGEQREIAARAGGYFSELEAARAEIDAARQDLQSLESALLDTTATAEGDTVPLSEVAYIQSGLAKGRPKDGETVAVPYIRTANVQAGFLDLAEMKTLNVTADQMDRYSLQPGDVLVLEGGDADKVGRGWIWQGEISPCLHQNHVFAVRPTLGKLDPWFLAYYINSPQARTYFAASAKQTTNLASINKTQLMALPVPVIAPDEQRRRVEWLGGGLEEVRMFRASLEEVEHLLGTLVRAVRKHAVEGELIGQNRDELRGEVYV